MEETNIAIIGLGLIGGSIAKALNVHKGNIKIIASDTDIAVLKKAEKAGWVDYWHEDPKDAVKDADIVVLCVPVCSMFELSEKIAPFMKGNSILTDVGSVKGILHEKLGSLLPDTISYIGGHPMAGSEKSGLDASDASLFVGRPFVIIPPKNVKQDALDKIYNFIKLLRAIPVVMDETEHDFAAAMVSHMPHVLSVALMLAALDDESVNNARFLAAGCFRDMTRVSGADARMWTDICLTNPEAIIKQTEKVEKLLNFVKDKISEKDEKWLMDFFARGRVGREKFGMFVIDGKGE